MFEPQHTSVTPASHQRHTSVIASSVSLEIAKLRVFWSTARLSYFARRVVVRRSHAKGPASGVHVHVSVHNSSLSGGRWGYQPLFGASQIFSEIRCPGLCFRTCFLSYSSASRESYRSSPDFVGKEGYLLT